MKRLIIRLWTWMRTAFCRARLLWRGSKPFLPLQGKTVVGLDTVVFRELCHSEPDWVRDFEAMAKAGFEFALADHLLAEVADQLERNSITDAQYRAAIGRASRFISKTTPVLPGKYHLAGLTGCLEPCERIAFDSVEAIDWLKNVWALLSSANNVGDLHDGLEFESNGKRFKVAVKPGAAVAALERERVEWRSHIKSFDAIPDDEMPKHIADLLNGMRTSLDKDSTLEPPLSARLDLATRHMLHQIVARNRGKNPYNPDAKKKRNDGIDFNMDYVMMTPAFLVSCDKNYVKTVRALPSYQGQWAFLPDDFVAAWKSGSLPKLEFESVV